MRTKEQFVDDYVRDNHLDLVKKSIVFAIDCHKNHKRKDGMPYIVHPLEVVYILSLLKFRDENILGAAATHDVVEELRDNEGIVMSLKELEEKTSRTIAWLTMGLTKPKKKMRFN